VFEVGSCPVPPAAGFGNNYFRCQSSNPIVWEVEENIISSEEDSHDFLAAADTNKYIGQVFMTYMRDDAKAGATTDYGDQVAVINNGATPITVNVRMWAGTPPAGAWGAVLITSPSIPAKGVWMYSPSAPATHDRGGTDGAAQGHYRFDISGGTGMLYKGNTFAAYTAPGNRDNMILFGPDMGDGGKVGDDLVGVVVTDGGGPHIVITNQGPANATYEILKFNPTTPGFFNGTEYLWPVDGDDPTGSWVQVATGTIATSASDFYNAGALTNAGFYRVRSTNGQPLSAEFGSAILQQTWCDGDYIYASDTRLAFGRRFNFGGKFFSAANNADPVQLHVVAPLANTTVHVWVDGSVSGPAFYNVTQTTTVADAGLAFPFAMPGSTFETWTCHIQSDKVIYSYVMSSTDATSSAPGETFFSVPPPINPLVVASKSVNRSTATLGDTLTYTLVAENPGSGTVTNAKIWDTLPSGVTFVSASPAPTLSTPPFFMWNLGSIASGQASTVTMAAVITAGYQLEVKHNTATAGSDLTPPFESNDAPVTILIPGANLQKTVDKAQAMPGDTLTYVLSYTNTQPPLPNTPKLDLLVKTGTYDAGGLKHDFEVINNDAFPININDLMICAWVNNSSPPGLVTFANDYGGGTSPWVWGGPTLTGTAVAWNPPQSLPANRQANQELCIHATSGQTLAAGQTWNAITGRFVLSYPQAWDNHLDDYSRDPASGSYVSDHHFALYYQGKLVTEYSNSSTPDPNTGLEPAYIWLEDFVPSDVNYLASTPAATVAGPQLTWTLDAVAPASTVKFTFTGTVKAGTPPGTIIYNDADYSTAAGPGISNKVQTLVGNATLSVVKSINKNVFTFGETVTYCFAWSNTGTAAVNVTIWDTLNSVLTYVGSDHAPTSVSGNFLLWDLGTQAANTSGSVCVYARISAYPMLPPWNTTPQAVIEQPWRQLLGWWKREPWQP
jgi:uncharacterized repeat protein (TIGR01451 family)